jgi:periplasmic protein TonB
MDPQDMLRADPLDILFDNRNKSYGAYPLRKFYAQRLCISFGFTLSLVILCWGLYLHFRTIPVRVPVFTLSDLTLEQVDLTPKIKPDPPRIRPAAPRAVAQVSHVTLLVVPDREDIKPLATTEALSKTKIGLKTILGPPDEGQIPEPGKTQAGVSSADRGDSTETKSAIVTWAEVMPEFPGGIEALKRYLLKNLRMPENNLEPGARIQVVARFVVGTQGHVQDIEITRGSAEIFNAEVKRVIANMPDWKPGLQNHRPVAVYFNLPVNFENVE